MGGSVPNPPESGYPRMADDDALSLTSAESEAELLSYQLQV